jgi:SAGA-associated factor 29
VRCDVIIVGDARGVGRLTSARLVSLDAALAEVPAELQRILTTIGELDQRNARLRDAVQAKVDDCVSAASVSARGSRNADVEAVNDLKEEISAMHASMQMVSNEKIRLAQLALDMVKGNAAQLDGELKAFHKELEEQGINPEEDVDEGYAYQAMQHAKQQRMQSQPRAPPPQMRRAPSGQMMSSMDVGDLVAANVGVLNQSAGGQEWIVATVTRYSPSEGVFEIVDADEEAEKHVYRLPQKFIIPLPKTASVRHSQNFPAGTSVLAVYPNTTTFYKARVVQPARRTPNAEYSDFVLEFEDDGDADGQAHRAVPFRHVVLFPRNV